MKRTVEIDDRGRITIPHGMREGVNAFIIEPQADRSIRLVPQKQVSLEDAKLIESLKKSAEEFKKGKLRKMPSER